MSERIEVCPADELDHLERAFVTVGNREICVFNVDGEYHALQNTCMHQYGPVCEGDLERKLTGEHGDAGDRIDVRYADGEYVIVCPWHTWTYDIETGAHTGDPNIAIPTFDVVVEGGTIYLVP